MRIRILAILFLLTVGCAKKATNSFPLLSFVPENSSLIIKINDQTAFLSQLDQNDLLKTLSATSAYNTIAEKTSCLKYLKSNSESILTFVELGKGNFEGLYITESSEDLFQLNDSIQKEVANNSYQGKTIHTYQLDQEEYYTTEIEDKTIISTAKLLLENLIRNQNNLKTNESLHKLFTIANQKSSANIFINLNLSKSFPLGFLGDAGKVDISKFSDWAAFDFDMNKDHVKLGGISIATDVASKYSKLFSNTRPMANRTPNFAPFGTEAIVSHTFEDYKIFSQNQKKYLDRSVVIDTTFKAVEEIGFVYVNQQKAVLVHTYNAETILHYLDELKVQSDEYQGNEIVTLSKGDFLNHYFNPLVKGFQAKHYTILENAFVFAPSMELLKTFISNFKNASTFEKTSYYKTARTQLADESSILFVGNHKGIEYFLNEFADEKTVSQITTDELSQYTFAAQMVSDENFHHTTLLAQKIAHETHLNTTTPLFTLGLDHQIATNPQFVTNHNSKLKEIVFQDQQNILYLISTSGKVLWKKQLDGKIQGAIEQVDLYKNGRLQLAFTTHNQFLILDRNGKEVRPFNFSYEGGNLNPLAVFDYDGNKNYRFVVSQGTKIFMYNSAGKIVKGFKYDKAESPVIGTPKHFRIGKKDYLVFKNEGGRLQILSRTGETRIAVKETINFSDNPVLLHKNKFAVTDQKGTLFLIDEKGKINRENLKLQPDHGIDATDKTLAVMNDNILSIRNKKVELELGVYSKPKIFYLNDKIYVSVTDIQNQKIYLFDSQALPISNFPVPGNSIIDLEDMDNDHKLELVVKDQNNGILVYRIN